MPAKRKIKICGITRQEDAKLAASLGAWALGYIFFEGSPRVVKPQEVRSIIGSLSGSAGVSTAGLRHVGVFVNSDLATLSDVIDRSGINTLQLHGDESPAECEELKRRHPQVFLIKAFQLKDQQQLGRLKEYSVCDHFLIDTYAKDQRGGTGKVADWSLARLAKDFGPVILAGGLNPGNIKEAFQTVEPFAVDVSSGVEERPGIKSTEKLHKLFEACAGHD